MLVPVKALIALLALARLVPVAVLVVRVSAVITAPAAWLTSCAVSVTLLPALLPTLMPTVPSTVSTSTLEESV